MANDTEIIRQHMEETRTSLADKVERLENQVVHTVQEATEAVQDTVTNMKEAAHETVTHVKDTVQETMQTVREVFDVPLQVERHPWAMLAASVGIGFLGGTLAQRSRRTGSPPHLRPAEPRWTASATDDRVGRPVQSSWLDSVAQTFAPEVDKLKSLAVGTLVAVVRDLVTPSLPPHLQPQVQQMFDDVNTRLGGQAIHGPILDAATPHTERSAAEGVRYPRAAR